MRKKLFAIASITAVAGIFLTVFSSHGLLKQDPDISAAKTKGDQYEADATKQLRAADMMENTRNFTNQGPALREVAAINRQLGSMEHQRQHRLETRRENFYRPTAILGIFLIIATPILALIAWITPNPSPSQKN